MLTRRELLATSAGTSVWLGFGFATNVLATTSQPIFRAIPSTGETLPVIGLGANKWVADSDQMLAQLAATLTTFTSSGGRVIDTAPSYRSSESALGEIIANQGMRNAFFLATKVDRADSAEGLARMEQSLQNLQTDSVDLMQVHNMHGADNQLANLLNWKEAGRIRYIGLTTHRADQFAEMEELIHRYPVDFVQLNYSILDQRAAERLLPLAQDKQVAVIVNRPFNSGRLFKASGDAPLPDWAAEFDCGSWAQFFLKFIVSNPAVTCVIPGMTRPDHAADNMGAGFGRLPDKDQRARMASLFKVS
jgi:aryl-alcohol dehydrogenase-like predicted oxidoreductase